MPNNITLPDSGQTGINLSSVPKQPNSNREYEPNRLKTYRGKVKIAANHAILNEKLVAKSFEKRPQNVAPAEKPLKEQLQQLAETTDFLKQINERIELIEKGSDGENVPLTGKTSSKNEILQEIPDTPEGLNQLKVLRDDYQASGQSLVNQETLSELLESLKANLKANPEDQMAKDLLNELAPLKSEIPLYDDFLGEPSMTAKGSVKNYTNINSEISKLEQERDNIQLEELKIVNPDGLKNLRKFYPNAISSNESSPSDKTAEIHRCLKRVKDILDEKPYLFPLLGTAPLKSDSDKNSGYGAAEMKATRIKLESINKRIYELENEPSFTQIETGSES